MTTFKRLVCVGLDKCGTSWLYAALRSQPSFFSVGVKESGWYSDRAETPLPSKPGKVCLDISHNYFKIDHSLEALAADQDALIVLMLRNPFDRAAAHVNEFRKRGDIESCIFSKTNIDEIAIHSNYTEIVQKLQEKFPARLKIIFFEDVEKAPSQVIKELCDMCGTSFTETPQIYIKHNPRLVPRSRFIGRIFKLAARALRAIGLGSILQWLRLNPVVLALAFTRPSQYSEHFPASIEKLLKESLRYYDALRPE